MTCVTTLMRRKPHYWSSSVFTEDEHWCYWCRPELYAPMMAYCTLCCKCGDLINLPEEDPMNEGMYVCPDCWKELGMDD